MVNIMIYYEKTHNKTKLCTAYKKEIVKNYDLFSLYKHKEVIGSYMQIKLPKIKQTNM